MLAANIIGSALATAHATVPGVVIPPAYSTTRPSAAPATEAPTKPPAGPPAESVAGTPAGQAVGATTEPATTRPIVPLPDKWEGSYRGLVDLVRPGKPPGGPGTSVTMELIVTPLANKPGSVAWTIVYGEGPARQERPYELSPVPGFPGRFLMDEKNGILIDHALLGDTVVSQFRVGTALLMSRFELADDGVKIEIWSFQTTPSRKSKPEGMDLEVESYPSTVLQRGLLKRQ